MKAKKIKAKRIGDLQSVANKNPHWAANLKYNHLRVQLENGEEIHLLFTDADIKKARERAQKNPEDLPKVNWLRDILD